MYLGIDLGTSGVKVLLIDRDQKMVAEATQALELRLPRSGWAEQDPQDWIEATQMACARLNADHPKLMQRVKAVGLSGQMHGAVVVDRSGVPLAPCILWNDTRAHVEAAKLDADVRFRQITGNIVFPGFTAPKLRWLAHHEPRIFDETHKVLLPKDYLRYWLTGDFLTDMSDASGTGWLDVAARAWSASLIEACGMDAGQMPGLIEGSHAGGFVRSEVADQLGLPKHVVVAGGAGDNAATGVAMGCCGEGEGFVSLGTSGVMFAANDQFRPNPDSAIHAFCHALPQRWHQMGVMLAASAALNWYAKIAGKSAAQLTHALGEDLRPPSRVTFLPYLSGERTPHNDAAIRGAFLGLDAAHGPDDLTQSALEGISFGLRDSLEGIKKTGTRLDALWIVGGGARAPYWVKLIASVLGLPIRVALRGEYGAALGACRLAMLADGVPPDLVLLAPQLATQHEPDSDLIDAFDEAYHRFRQGYRTASMLMAE